MRYRDLFAELHAALITAQQERPQRQEWVEGPDGGEPAWAIYERAFMAGATNTIGYRYGLPFIPDAAIKRVEDSACGHFDYTKQYAHGCAKLIWDAMAVQAA